MSKRRAFSMILFLWVSALVAACDSASPGPTPQSSTEVPAGSTWRIASVEPVAFPDGALPNLMMVAPDGRHIAYPAISGELCIVDITGGEENCLSMPETMDFPVPDESRWPLTWSPDGARVAVFGSPIRHMSDTDLLIADFAAGTVTTLAADGYDGEILSAAPPEGTVVDSIAAWSPDGTRLAVERTVFHGEGAPINATLSIIDLESGVVTDLSSLPGSDAYPVDFGSTMALSWSPDGSTLAVGVAHARNNPEYDGLWLLDTSSGRIERLVTLDDMIAAYQAIYPGENNIFWPRALTWSPDGTRLLYWLPTERIMPGPWLFWVEIASGTIVSVPLPAHPADDDEFRAYWPRQAVWSPDGLLLVAAWNGYNEFVETLMPLDAQNEEIRAGLYLIDPATGESRLLGHLPETILPPGIAAWGADGQVIINGYHLEMARE